MANPNISLLGANYSDVSGVSLPKQGGGTATFPWVEGSETKTQNGTYDVTNLAQLIVNVSGGGGSGLVYETGEYKPTSNVAQPTISFTNTHTNPPISIIFYDATGTTDFTADTSWSFVWVDYEQFGGATVSWSSSIVKYASMYSWYRGTGTNSLSTSNASITYPYSYTSDTANTCYRYWVTASAFKPSSNSSSRYWRSGRTYKWIAVWKPTT